MAYSVECFRRVKTQLEERRSAALSRAEQNRQEFHQRCPAGLAIDRELEKTSMRLFRAACGVENPEQIARIREENLSLQEKKKGLLRALGLPEDYTEVKYACDACKDTGYDREGILCACMRRLLAEEEIRQSGIGALVDRQSFENFDLSGVSSKTRGAFEAIRQYGEDFTPDAAPSLLLIGKTGLGKTHLSTALAKRVIEKGYRVVYESMQNVVNDFNHDRFHSAEKPVCGRYYDAELLILDDVGTELPGPFATTVLYQLINTRQNRRMPTVISTNLFPAEIVERYDDRIGSRLMGGFRLFLFEGQDHRIHG